MIDKTLPNEAVSNARATQLLDEKFGLLESLGDLDDVVARARHQRDELVVQRSASSADIDEQVRQALERAHELLVSARDASLSRHVVADELAALREEITTATSTSSPDSSRTLLEELEYLHEKLEDLEQTRTYVRIIEHGTSLSETAVREFKAPGPGSASFAPSSLSQYVALQDFVSSVTDACYSTVSPNHNSLSDVKIVSFLQGLRNRTWRDIKAKLSAHLLEAAERIKWPMRVDYDSLGSSERKDFENTFLNLLRLQEFGNNIHIHDDSESLEAKDKPGLFPLQALIQPIAARFKFHFDGQRPTNRLDKPEWYFTHVLNIIHEHRPFIESVVARLVRQSVFKDVDPVHEFTALLLPILSRKIRRTVPALLPHPPLLAHTVYQTLLFDGSLKDSGFTLRGTSFVKKDEQDKAWEGLSEVILGQKDWFDQWLAGEQKFADNIFNDILGASDTWVIPDDGQDNDLDEIRPTTSARRVKALIEQVTDRYRPLPRFAHRAHFLIKIQIPILELFAARITSSLDAYETLSSSFLRAVPGALAGQVTASMSGITGDTRRLAEGVEGLSRLFKAWVSARFVKEAMEEWGEELFFLELWTEINEKETLRDRVAEHPSFPSTIGRGEAVEGTLFDELIGQYAKLTTRAEDMIVKQICYEVEGELKGYLAVFWDDPNSVNDQSSADASLSALNELSSTLLRPLTSLTTSLSFLNHSTSLPSSSLTVIYKRIVATLSAFLISRVVYYRSKGRFMGPSAGRIFEADVGYFIQGCEMALGKEGKVKRTTPAWSKLVDVTKLLGASDEEWRTVVQAVQDGISGTTGRGGVEQRWKDVTQKLGLSGALGREEAKDVVRARS